MGVIGTVGLVNSARTLIEKTFTSTHHADIPSRLWLLGLLVFNDSHPPVSKKMADRFESIIGSTLPESGMVVPPFLGSFSNHVGIHHGRYSKKRPYPPLDIPKFTFLRFHSRIRKPNAPGYLNYACPMWLVWCVAECIRNTVDLIKFMVGKSK